MKIAACYIRVSTADQTEYSPESQLRMIKDYATKNNFIISNDHIYRDEGISGRTAEKRPAFQKMISAAKQSPKPFDIILVYSTSRFARNHEQSIVYRSMLERECHIDVISITQPSVDKKTDMLTGAIYSIMDEWYSLDLSENVRRGMTQKALNGETQAAPPLGYELKHKGGIFNIKEDEAQIIRFIFDEFLKGTSKWHIAKRVNDLGAKSKRGSVISTRSIDYILRNVTYIGYARWTPTGKSYWDLKNPDTIIMKSKHKPIIEEEVFNRVQKNLDAQEQMRVKKERPFETRKHWLSGMIKCASCGTSLNYNSAIPKAQKAHFRCGGYGKGYCKYMNFILVEQAEKLVLDYLHKIFNNVNILYDAKVTNISDKANEISLLRKELTNIEKKLGRAKSAFIDGVFDLIEFKQIKTSLESEQLVLQSRLANLNQPISYEILQKNIQNTYNVLVNSDFSKDEKLKAVKDVISSIVFDKKSGLFQINFYN